MSKAQSPPINIMSGKETTEEQGPVESVKEPKEPVREPETKEPTALTDSGSDGVGARVSKKFGGKHFFGNITEKWMEEKLPRWHVRYDDGDEEDFNEEELGKATKRYEKSKRYDVKLFPRKARTTLKSKHQPARPPRTNKFPKRKVSKNKD